MKVVFIYANGQRFYETIAMIGSSFDLGDFMRKCQRHAPAVMCELAAEPKRYILKASCGESTWPDYYKTPDALWTTMSMVKLGRASLAVYSTESEAQAAIDSVTLNPEIWALSYEEYTE